VILGEDAIVDFSAKVVSIKINDVLFESITHGISVCIIPEHQLWLLCGTNTEFLYSQLFDLVVFALIIASELVNLGLQLETHWIHPLELLGHREVGCGSTSILLAGVLVDVYVLVLLILSLHRHQSQTLILWCLQNLSAWLGIHLVNQCQTILKVYLRWSVLVAKSINSLLITGKWSDL